MDEELLRSVEDLERGGAIARAAAVALAARGKTLPKDARLLAALVRRLGDADRATRAGALTAAGWLGHLGLVDPSTKETLLGCLSDDEPMARHDAAWLLESLAKQGHAEPRAVEGLVANLGHENADVRAASAYCLGTLARHGAAPPSAVEAVRRLASDPEEGVRKAVETALAVAAKAKK